MKLNDDKKFTHFKKHPAVAQIPQVIPRNAFKGDNDHRQHLEWIDAIKENKPELCYSRFAIAAPFTEIMLLGCVALRVGKKIEWDGPAMRVANAPEAAQFIKRDNRAAGRWPDPWKSSHTRREFIKTTGAAALAAAALPVWAQGDKKITVAFVGRRAHPHAGLSGRGEETSPTCRSNMSGTTTPKRAERAPEKVGAQAVRRRQNHLVGPGSFRGRHFVRDEPALRTGPGGRDGRQAPVR